MHDRMTIIGRCLRVTCTVTSEGGGIPGDPPSPECAQ